MSTITLFVLAIQIASAQTRPSSDQPVTKKETTVTQQTNRDGTTIARHYQKSSEMVGQPISIDRQNVGKVEDLLVDVNSGRVVYGVGSFTNLEGSSDRFYPIPYTARHFSPEGKAFEMQIESERLRAVPSFPRTEWPRFTDQEFATRTFQSYNQKPYWETRSTSTTSRTDRPTTTTQTSSTTWSEQPSSVHRISELRGREIRTPEGTRLGTVDEFVIDPESGRTLYAVTTREGKSVPIPYSALRASDNRFEVSITEDRWKNAPTLESNKWPSLVERRWSEDVYRHYDVDPYWDSKGSPDRD